MQTRTNLRPTHDRRRQQGFTLIEIMVVIVLLGILVTMASTNVFGLFGENQIKTAQIKVKMLAESVTLYRTHYGRMPSSLEDLATKDEKNFAIENELPRDPWNHDYIFKPGDRGGDFEIISCGPDGQEGTDDDISNRKKDQ